LQKPVHGKLKKLNVTTYEYKAKAGYKGSDTFAIKATGQGPTASGKPTATLSSNRFKDFWRRFPAAQSVRLNEPAIFAPI